jgi:hypothetical protein
MSTENPRRKHRFLSIAEVRTIDYIVRELGCGRELFVILEDPYVRNRIPLERRSALQEDEELLEAFMAEIDAVRASMESSDNAADFAENELG